MTGETRHPETLLLVDDNPGDRRLVEEAFRDPGLETTVHAVRTGERALDFLRQRGEYEDAPEPDVILLDRNLGRTDGAEFLEEIREGFPGIPVILMTGTVAGEALLRTEADRADAYLAKPSDPAEYVEAVRSVH